MSTGFWNIITSWISSRVQVFLWKRNVVLIKTPKSIYDFHVNSFYDYNFSTWVHSFCKQQISKVGLHFEKLKCYSVLYFIIYFRTLYFVRNCFRNEIATICIERKLVIFQLELFENVSSMHRHWSEVALLHDC